MVPDLDPDKPDPDPVWPDLDPAISGSGSGLPGSRSGNIRIWIRLLPDLDPVAAGSKVPHELSGPVQALTEPDTHHLKRLRWQRKLVEIINSE